jgi:hypothetical protein
MAMTRKPNPKTITLQLGADDAEPFLRDAAFEAAKFSALLDHITRRTHDAPGYRYRDPDWYSRARREWQARFLRAKRIVEAFGVEYEQTSEPETLTIVFPQIGGERKIAKIGGFRVIKVSGQVDDENNPIPAYRREVHTHACHAAAARVVRRWREVIA